MKSLSGLCHLIFRSELLKASNREMNKYCLITLVMLVGAPCIIAQDLPLQTPKWQRFFEEKTYLEKGRVLTDETFWEVNDSYTRYDTTTLLLIYINGRSEELLWQYDGLSMIVDKSKAFLDENFERVEKENLAYIVFDGLLFRNPNMGNSVAGDFTVVLAEGPISVYREYYACPITKDNLESGLIFTRDGKPFSDFYLGKFEKKAAKLVADHLELADKIRSQKAGYFNSLEDILRIANEYNEWVRENNSYRYDDWSGLTFDR